MQTLNPTARTAPAAVDTNRVLRNTYALLSMTLLFSAVTAVHARDEFDRCGDGLRGGSASVISWFVAGRRGWSVPSRQLAQDPLHQEGRGPEREERKAGERHGGLAGYETGSEQQGKQYGADKPCLPALAGENVAGIGPAPAASQVFKARFPVRFHARNVARKRFRPQGGQRQIVVPMIAAVSRVARKPMTSAFGARLATSARRSGARIVMPPIRMPREPRLAKPQSA